MRHGLRIYYLLLITVMADNLQNRGPADRSRVNVNEVWEVRWWCGQFGCTETQLRAAVKAVGVMVVDVRRYLANNK
jgi:hypothetical protein